MNRVVTSKHAWWLVPVLSLIGSGLFGYFAGDKQTSNRITALESKREVDNEHLKHVEEKVDKIYDKLLDWEHAK